MFFAIGALSMLAKTALTTVIMPFVEEAKEATLNAAQDTIRGAIAGRMTIEEWAEIVIQGVDKVKDRAVEEGNLRFIGGKLKFAPSENNLHMVSISFDLYFLDEHEKWQKAAAENEIPVSKFTPDAVEELKSRCSVIFEIE